MLTTHMIGICGVALSAFVFLAILGSEYAAKWISAPVHKHRSGSMYDSRPEDWTYIGTTGGIESYLRKVEGSNLLAFRGVAYLDMHISQAMGPYINISTARQWVSMLKHIQQLAVQDSNTAKTKKDFDAEDLVYQVLDLPWPVSPRDVLLHRKFYFTPDERTVAIRYQSVDDARIPKVPGVIRANSPHSMWRFRSVQQCDVPDLSSPSTVPRLVHNGPKASSIQKTSWFSRQLRKLPTSKPGGEIQISFNYKRSKSPTSTHSRVSKAPRGLSPVVLSKGGNRPGDGELPAFANKLKNAVAALRNLAGVSTAVGIGKKDPSVGVDQVGGAGLAGLRCAAECGGKGYGRLQDRGVGTVVEFESFVDSRGSIPAWFINYMQRSFPAQALTAYRKLAETGSIAPYAAVQDW